MVFKLIFSGFVGLIFGIVGMAILTSGGRAEEIEKETILRDALRKVWRWYSRKDRESIEFPAEEIHDALKMD